ncbi:unannotated protein [freshwater metagenome]|uniref:Unannotated protein n=1 Tax=freshwater metagenome TaxID=449393 RepID=A0A6J6LHE8_9ZZZZ
MLFDPLGARHQQHAVSLGTLVWHRSLPPRERADQTSHCLEQTCVETVEDLETQQHNDALLESPIAYENHHPTQLHSMKWNL